MCLISSIIELFSARCCISLRHIALCGFKSFLSLSYLKRFYRMSLSSLSRFIIVGCSLLTWKTEMAQSSQLWIKPPVPSLVPQTLQYHREQTQETNNSATRRSVAVATEVWSWDEQLCQSHYLLLFSKMINFLEGLAFFVRKREFVIRESQQQTWIYYCTVMFPDRLSDKMCSRL